MRADMFSEMRMALERRLAFLTFVTSYLVPEGFPLHIRWKQTLYVHKAWAEPGCSLERNWSHILSSPSSLLKEKQRWLFYLHLPSLCVPTVHLSPFPKQVQNDNKAKRYLRVSIQASRLLQRNKMPFLWNLGRMRAVLKFFDSDAWR